MAKPKFVLRTFGNYDPDEASMSAGFECADDSVVQHQFAEEVDINTIVRRFGLTGELPNGIGMPVSGDFSAVTDFHTAMNMVRQAEESFMLLPGEVRERFANDPAKVIAFLDDPANRDEAVRLGIVAPPPEVVPDSPPKQ